MLSLSSPHHLRLFRPRRDAPDLIACLGGFKSGPLIKGMSLRPFRAGEQHHLVAIMLPGMFNRVGQHPPAITRSTMVRMGNHIFNQTIGPAASGQIGNDGERTGTDQLVGLSIRQIADEKSTVFHGMKGGQSFGSLIRRKRSIFGGQILIERKKPGQIHRSCPDNFQCALIGFLHWDRHPTGDWISASRYNSLPPPRTSPFRIP